MLGGYRRNYGFRYRARRQKAKGVQKDSKEDGRTLEEAKLIGTNLTSVYNLCQAVMRQMISQRYGRLINMSSVAAEFANQGQVNYAASKGGIQGLTRCLATEVGRRNITVNAVAPGFIETDMTEAVVNAAGKDIKKMISVRRLGKPEDIANAVLFLAADETSYVTGHVLVVDGGLTLGGI